MESKLRGTKGLIFGVGVVGVLAFGSLSASSGVKDANVTCPTPTGQQLTVEEMRADLHQTVLSTQRSDVLVGVDALGRVAVAVDLDKNSVADRILLYTAQDRLSGPWSRFLSDAMISIQKGTVLVLSNPDDFALSAAVSVASPQTVPSWASKPIVLSGGRELVQLFDEKGTVPMTALDHAAITSWPESLWMDLLAQQQAAQSGATTLGGCERQCCDDGSCTGGGGFPSSNCSVGGCIGSPTNCSVGGCGGTVPDTFSCCKCGIDGQGGNANCRCKACACGACP